MKLKLIRFDSQNDYTRGVITEGGKIRCFTLEDEYRPFKVKGETRIPAGTYEIKYRRENSPMTKSYRKRFPHWFDWHLELQDVPNFKYVYIHIGNDDDDTDGCILVGETMDATKPNFIGQSTDAFKELYKDISKALERGEKVEIRILAV